VSDHNKAVSRRFTELFTTGDEAAADQIFDADVVFHGTRADGEVRGREALKAFIAGYRRAFPDARSTVEDQIAEGDMVVTRWRAARSDLEMQGITIERIVDGRIVEVWVARDELGATIATR
jgi:ketosteroid isomerase-like protein